MVTLTTELRQVLRAAYECWHSSPNPPDQRSLCFEWIVVDYQRLFGGMFHQVRLRQLADLGLLVPGDLTRAGARRYYTMPDPLLVYQILTSPV
jgi:hypothetical protein